MKPIRTVSCLLTLLAVPALQMASVAGAAKDRDWPAKYGEASICLWKDDAMAAASITVDDNTAPDHPWWQEMTKKYNLKVTWFVITNRVTANPNGYGGTWEGFNALKAAGHDIQSHTVTHLDTDSPGWPGVEAEYANSQKEINEKVPGAECQTLAYPGGKNFNLNDPTLAAKYYIGARGTSGSMNAIGKTNYMMVNSMGADIFIGDAKFPSQEFNNLFNPSSPFYRGWYCAHYHGVKPEFREKAEQRFAALKEKVQNGDVWCGLFREVCKYGQERDVAALQVKEKAPGKIVFGITDTLDNQKFDYPLTVKVNVGWNGAVAEQSGKSIPVKLVDQNGSKFALVQAVPDSGDVTLTKQ